MTGRDVLIRAGQLATADEPFALATVIAVVPPASAQRGDRALVTADGALSGWVGGACAEPVVIREALRALADSEPRLVRIAPPGRCEADPDVLLAESACASEGVIDVLVEPQRPAPLLSILGRSPAARKLGELAHVISWRTAGQLDPRADAVVVASMGQGDEEALEAALAGPAAYVGLVASARRAAKVAAGLRSRGVPEPALARLRSPAGLDLGHCTQEEIAVAILAELVAWRHARSSPAPAEAMDPVCGMVVVPHSVETTSFAGVTYAFCGPACRQAFEADPGRYAGGTATLQRTAS